MAEINNGYRLQTFGVLIVLCAVGIHPSYADITVEVLKTQCGLTFNLTLHQKIDFIYNTSSEENNTIFLNADDRCAFHILNIDEEADTCLAKPPDDLLNINCIFNFEYHIGSYEPGLSNYPEAVNCMDFSYIPLCTSNPNSYAVFKNSSVVASRPFTMQVYSRKRPVTTTSTRSMFTTSPYQPTYNRNDGSPSRVATIVGVIVAVVIVIAAMLSIYSYQRRRKRRFSGAHPVRYGNQCPPYSTNQGTRGDNGAWQVHAMSSSGMTPSAPPQTYGQYGYPQLQSNQNMDTCNGQTTSDPPPSYSSLGIGSSDVTSGDTQCDSGGMGDSCGGGDSGGGGGDGGDGGGDGGGSCD